ncbi:tetratricopeptide repeat protein [Actinoplanes auranticolor]|uniref:Tetratricopeptide repeat protein n=1 Tax=Actinoplanes auranticolor TaxID=47988 RepID=A0A919VVW7_9ACTN|nr:tetratricopeptide repeat protein [Actinoplanes auranticolor]GIM77080.1 tetratricopeptide repeat protein [Actinoplanes auranticolor]
MSDDAVERHSDDQGPPVPVALPGARGVQVGAGNFQTNIFLARASSAEDVFPLQIGSLPPIAASFQARHGRSPETPQLTNGITVLVGLGGVGKTQLAAAVSHRARRSGETDLIVWVNGTSRDAIIAAYAQTAHDLGVATADAADTAAQRLLTWLANTDRRWLLVIDDLREPGHMNNLWPPLTSSGSTIVTTRRREAALRGSGRHFLEVGVFTPEESDRYLRSQLPPAQLDGAADLADDLGHLPLALAQASAFMLNKGLTCRQYIRRLGDQRRRLSQVLPERGALPDDHSQTLAATWSLTIRDADALDPPGLAKPLIHLIAFLEPNGIPHGLLLTLSVHAGLLAALDRSDAARGPRGEVESDDIRDALYNLQRWSLISMSDGPGGQSLRIHALVQRAVRESLTDDERDSLVATNADALVEIWPEPETDMSVSQVLRANAVALLRHNTPALWRDGPHPLIRRLGRSLGESGSPAQAVAHFTAAYSHATRVLGEEHPEALDIRSELAQWRGATGDYAGCLANLRSLLTGMTAVHGVNHPRTLAVRHSLAGWLGTAGEPTAAVTALTSLASDSSRILGDDHPDTLAIHHSLAGWLGTARRHAAAVTALTSLASDCSRVLGDDHPDTLAVHHSLARWRGASGDAGGAAKAFGLLHERRSRLLGRDHPETLLTFGNMAYWRGVAGDAAGAEQAFRRLHADRSRLLGSEHPDSLTTLGNVGHWLGVGGDPDGAARTFQALDAQRSRVLGDDHPHTLNGRAHLAYWLGERGAPQRALVVLSELLAHRRRVLGEEHPDTFATHQQIAYWRIRNGEQSEARADLAALLIRLGGPSSDKDQSTLDRRLRHWPAGEQIPAYLLRRMRAEYLRVLGADHPTSVSSRRNLARWRG